MENNIPKIMGKARDNIKLNKVKLVFGCLYNDV